MREEKTVTIDGKPMVGEVVIKALQCSNGHLVKIVEGETVCPHAGCGGTLKPVNILDHFHEPQDTRRITNNQMRRMYDR